MHASRPLLLLLALLSAPAYAGEQALTLSVGQLGQRDLQASPLRYGAQELSLALGARWLMKGWMTEAVLRGGAGNLHQAELPRRQLSFTYTDTLTGEEGVRAFPEPQGSVLAGLDLSARHRVGESPLRLGGALVGDALYSADGVAFGTWAWSSLELGPSLGAKIEIGRDHSLHLDADFSVISVVTRFPPTLNPLLPDTSQVGGFFATGTRLAGPGSHPSAHASARYVIDPPGPWAYASTLELAWMYDAWPEPLYRARAQLGLTLLRQQEWHR
ncbi:MAG: hypothetical protein H6741_08150 [Alphaproteobacteria bacterium]|nr:hypothetical protein [Alphaproteobacteria bacterium]